CTGGAGAFLLTELGGEGPDQLTLAEEAAGAGVTLAVEPLNRFETSLLNTTEQTLEVVDGIPGLGIALDTFHMNIEERDIPTAIRTAGDWLAHVQVCANDRGAPGNDHLDWTGIAAALRDVGYDGPLCIESFTAENRTIATAAAIWRPLAPTQDQLATTGLAFLRALLARSTAPTGV
ncbi:sugar phosphate isomerase/epimerase family protein, partial [Micromonospora sp. NPDC049799]|uniref:sugar phosphate isomerase/epimerase family protein n=1 Tax=Micromonospora sp. NPDC049799 TaxID=3154741 RepID=UPI0033ED4E57